ncbi:unnamed protein product [Echinostoma caproni]|uniref:Endo/exonuclease/phosphatase domain-containing protein n=1 Tax=Echinostoma caproni TaxID=27848 RepID=A0A183BE96_9TREM|nr:unnamed protein product [Echinostoma caproni]
MAGVYRGPGATQSEDQQTIQALDNMARNSTRLVAMGDFNLSIAGCPPSEHIIEGILDARLAVSIFSPVETDLT